MKGQAIVSVVIFSLALDGDQSSCRAYSAPAAVIRTSRHLVNSNSLKRDLIDEPWVICQPIVIIRVREVFQPRRFIAPNCVSPTKTKPCVGDKTQEATLRTYREPQRQTVGETMDGHKAEEERG